MYDISFTLLISYSTTHCTTPWEPEMEKSGSTHNPRDFYLDNLTVKQKGKGYITQKSNTISEVFGSNFEPNSFIYVKVV